MLELNDPLAAVVAAIAARQHGVIGRRQLLDAGMCSSSIAFWARAGHLHPIHRGVYAVGHRRITKEGEWMAAVLACRAGSVLSHGPTGQLFGVINRRERVALHVTLPGRGGAGPAGIVVHRPRLLDPQDSTRHHGIPTTTATRAIWDLASTLPAQPTRRAFEQAEKLRVLNRPRLAQLVNASPSRKGAVTIRTLLNEHPLPLDQARSWLEELLLQICRDHNLPLPAVNVPLLDYQVDFLWPAARFVVEPTAAIT